MTVIGLTGYPNTGKDYIAKHLVKHHGFTRYAFGDAVKEMLIEIDPVYSRPPMWLGMENRVPMEVLERMKRYGLYHTREKLQRLGMVMRDMDPDFWVKRIEAKGVTTPAVFTDIRFQNELEYVERNFGGIVMGIQRIGCGPVNNHISEVNTGTLLAEASVRITNNGFIEDTVAKVLEAARAGAIR